MRKQMIVASGFALVLVLAACGKTNYNATSSTKSKPKTEPAVAAQATTPPAPPATVAVAKSDKGDVLVDANGMTLYRYSGDTKPGDTNGDGFGNVWHVVTVGAPPIPATAPAPARPQPVAPASGY